MLAQYVFLAVSLLLTALFFLYGFNHYYLIRASRRYRAPALPDMPEPRPAVAIHLPVYRERYVIRRLVDACALMAERYGRDRVRIVVIDDSDDDTVAEVDAVVAEHRQRGFMVEALRRERRQGFKAGALQAALERSDEPFLAIFDADFTPPPDFLVRAIPYLANDARIGVVQSRWTHINRDYSPLTRAIATGIDVHFLVEQPARYAAGCLQNFNGSGGVLRRQALIDAGGWQADTLAEDLDASYRIQMRGYRVLYLRDLQSPGEIPPTVPAFKRQQGRWACGSLRTARKLLPSLLRDSSLGWKRRLQAFIHLTGYMVHPLMFASFIVACLGVILRLDTFRIARLAFTTTSEGGGPANVSVRLAMRDLSWVSLGMVIGLCTVAAWVSPVMVLRSQHFTVSRQLSSLLLLFLLGVGVSLSNTIEAGKALLTNVDWAFKRTPKYAIRQGRGGWRSKRYQVPLDYVCALEGACLCLGLAAMASAVWRGTWAPLLILVPYTAAYAFVFVLTLWQSLGSAAR